MLAPPVIRYPNATFPLEGRERYPRPMAKQATPHQKAEAALTRYGLTLPETVTERWIPPMRALNVRTKTFCIFGEKNQALDALTITLKLPISAEMVADLPFVRESKGWYKQHDWVIAHFGPDDDIVAEMDLLRGWMLQSYRAIAPNKLAKLTS